MTAWSTATTTMPGVGRFLERRLDAGRIGRVDDDRVDAGADQVADVLELAGGVGVAVGDVERLATLPEASACALIAQIISSRQPLPCTVLETPIV